MVKKVLLAALGVFMVLAGVVTIVNSQQGTVEPIEASTITKDDIEENGIYKADKVYIADSYAQQFESNEAETLENSDTLYAVVLIPVKDEKVVMGSMTITKSNELYDEFKQYLGDDTKEAGDLYIGGYIQCKGEMGTGERQQLYSKYVLEETVLLNNIQAVYMDFTYLGETEADMQAELDSDKTTRLIVGIAFIVIGVALVLVAIFVIKKKPPVPPVPPMYNQPYDPSQWQAQGGRPNYNQPYSPPGQAYVPNQQAYVPPQQQPYAPPQQTDGQQQPPYGQQ